jgi:putative heme-binding domain-containing protein
LKTLPTVWEAIVEPKALGKNPVAWRLAARLIATSPPNPELATGWQKLARQADAPPASRTAYLAALGVKLENPSEAEVRDWLAGLHRDRPAEERAACVRILALTALTPKHFEQLAASLPTSGTMELQSLVTLFKNAPEPVLKATLAEMVKAPWRVGLRGDDITKAFEKHPEPIRHSVSALVASLNVNADGQRVKLDMLAKELPTGDVRRGQTVFNSAKAACSSCHAIGYLGGKVGPDLTRIGGIRTERDLLEAIVFPSASFVRSYEPVKVERADGRVHTGNLKRESPTEIVLVVSATEELTIPRSDIENITPSTVSVMPSGLDQQLSKQDLADLIAFLKASR